MEAITKTCFKCGKTFPLEAFYRHERMADGHLNKCKECTKKDVGEQREKNAAHYRAYDRARAKLPHRVEQAKKVFERWKAANPNRRKAQIILGNAVRDGRVKKMPCFICGDKAEAHHPDYSQPLDVVWLCPAHHKQAHHNK